MGKGKFQLWKISVTLGKTQIMCENFQFMCDLFIFTCENEENYGIHMGRNTFLLISRAMFCLTVDIFLNLPKKLITVKLSRYISDHR